MLARAHRLVDPLDFRRVVRRGVRLSGTFVTIHVVAQITENSLGQRGNPSRVGFIVSKAIGGAVARNKVKRRLRSIVSAVDLAPGCSLVVRAAPRSAEATFSELRLDVERLVMKVAS